MADKKDKTRLTIVEDVSFDEMTAPKNGESFAVYKLKDILDGNEWNTTPRHKRQRGKVDVAQKFRRAQGAYLKARLHFFTVAKTAQSSLRWWFSNGARISLHHQIMVPYYLEDRPTLVEELVKNQFAKPRIVMQDLKTAEEMGSIEIDVYKGDKRKRVVYPTRGLVSETDNLFGRVGGPNDGLFVNWAKELDQATGDGTPLNRYSLKQYVEDYKNYLDMVLPHLPDTDRDI